MGVLSILVELHVLVGWRSGMFSPMPFQHSYLTCLGNYRHVSSRRSIILLDPTSAIRTILSRAHHHVNHPPHHNACVSLAIPISTSLV